jgi:hypothetical protein
MRQTDVERKGAFQERAPLPDGRKGDRQERQDQTHLLEGEKKSTEKWYYNCGENDFIYVLTFEGTILKKEETGATARASRIARAGRPWV